MSSILHLQGLYLSLLHRFAFSIKSAEKLTSFGLGKWKYDKNNKKLTTSFEKYWIIQR
jgi:hypothetical protein